MWLIIRLVPYFRCMVWTCFRFRVSSHGGNIRGLVQISGGPWRTDESVETLIAHERARKSTVPKLGATTAKKLSLSANAFADCYRKLRARENPLPALVPGQGDHADVYFGLGPDIIDFIADDF